MGGEVVNGPAVDCLAQLGESPVWFVHTPPAFAFAAVSLAVPVPFRARPAVFLEVPGDLAGPAERQAAAWRAFHCAAV